MKKNMLTLLKAIGSILVLSPTLAHSAPSIQSSADAFRRDAKAVRSDFNRAMSSVGMTEPQKNDEK